MSTPVAFDNTSIPVADTPGLPLKLEHSTGFIREKNTIELDFEAIDAQIWTKVNLLQEWRYCQTLQEQYDTACRYYQIELARLCACNQSLRNQLAEAKSQYLQESDTWHWLPT